MKSSELSNGENPIALRQLLQNRKLWHLWRHNLGSREKLCTNKQTNKQTDTTKIMVTWPWTKIHTQCLIATVTKCWCLEQQYKTHFQFPSKGVQGQIKTTGMPRKTIQRRGPAVAKARSPRRDLVPIKAHLKLSDDRSWWCLVVGMS